MSILERIKKRLPIVGQGSQARPFQPPPQPSSTPRWEPEPGPESPRGDQDPMAYIEQVVAENTLVLFMKGSPDAPACGFSANAAGILSSYGKPFHHVDVILDPEVREKVKTWSSWPTLPQLYVAGELIGGSDIVAEMHTSGELGEAIEAAFASEG